MILLKNSPRYFETYKATHTFSQCILSSIKFFEAHANHTKVSSPAYSGSDNNSKVTT